MLTRHKIWLLNFISAGLWHLDLITSSPMRTDSSSRGYASVVKPHNITEVWIDSIFRTSWTHYLNCNHTRTVAVVGRNVLNHGTSQLQRTDFWIGPLCKRQESKFCAVCPASFDRFNNNSNNIWIINKNQVITAIILVQLQKLIVSMLY